MDQPKREQTKWPYRSLIIMGFFGPDSPQGKRLLIISTIGLLFFIAGFAGTQLLESTVWKYASAIQIPIAVLILVYANTCYIKSLDTLEKLIQLTAFSASYGAVLFIGFLLFALHSVTGFYVSPLWLLLAEPFRGLILFLTSRKYS